MNTSDGHLQIGQLHVFIKEVEEIVERLEVGLPHGIPGQNPREVESDRGGCWAPGTWRG